MTPPQIESIVAGTKRKADALHAALDALGDPLAHELSHALSHVASLVRYILVEEHIHSTPAPTTEQQQVVHGNVDRLARQFDELRAQCRERGDEPLGKVTILVTRFLAFLGKYVEAPAGDAVAAMREVHELLTRMFPLARADVAVRHGVELIRAFQLAWALHEETYREYAPHSHAHAHEDGHAHAHSHAHSHTHPHDHLQEHSHEHTHIHSHGHTHPHDHDHGGSESGEHAHGHAHVHTHPHTHPHEHTHASSESGSKTRQEDGDQ